MQPLVVLHVCTYIGCMSDNNWWTFVERTIRDDSPQVAADRAGFDKSNFSRWKRGSRPDVEFVVKLCRAYGTNVLDGLVAAGYITREEAGTREVVVGVEAALHSADLDDLLGEIKRRVRR